MGGTHGQTDHATTYERAHNTLKCVPQSRCHKMRLDGGPVSWFYDVESGCGERNRCSAAVATSQRCALLGYRTGTPGQRRANINQTNENIICSTVWQANVAR